MTTKQAAKIGQECWFVRWCYELAFEDDEQTTISVDECKHKTVRVATRDQAEAKAREVYPQSKTGHVEYWHAVYEAYDDGDGPYLPHWQATAEWPEIYEG